MLVKLKQFSMVEVEAEAFGELDKPDLYHEFYPVTSGEPASQSSGLATNAILFLLMLTELGSIFFTVKKSVNSPDIIVSV